MRSFVLRQGRFTPAQQRAFDELWPRFGLDYTGSPRDVDAAFGRKARRVLEIGFGNGEALRFAARHDQARDLIGIEVHAPGVGRLLNALAEDGSDHVRVYHHDAVEVLQRFGIKVLKFGELSHVRELIRLTLPQSLQVCDRLRIVRSRLVPLPAAGVPVGLAGGLVLHGVRIPTDDLSKRTLP